VGYLKSVITMGLKSRITSTWLRKGRRVEDRKILQKIMEDSSTWKASQKKLVETLFEKELGLNALPDEPFDAETINSILGQNTVTEKVRINKNNLTPYGADLRQMVESLLPKNLATIEASSLSYVMSRIVCDEIHTSFKWPVVPEGLDSLGAAIYTINIIAQQTDNNVKWLLPIWTLKADEYKLEQLKTISEVLPSGENEDIEDAMLKAKTNIEDFLGKDSFSGQDPLSDKIDSWRRTISNYYDTEEELKDARKELVQIRKNLDVEPKTISDKEAEIRRLESNLQKHNETIKQNNLVLEHEIQTMRAQNNLFTEWSIYSLHPGGPTAYKHESLLKNIRNEVNIMGYTPLVKLCRILQTSEQPGRPSATDLINELGLKQRMANYTLVRLGYILTEHYMLSPTSLGLRYRYIMTKNQKPGVMSDGLFERLTMQMNDNYSGCTAHLEPINSDGPSIDLIPEDAIQLTVDSEILSMRLNLFDVKEGVWDLSSSYDTNPLKAITMRDDADWLNRSTSSDPQDKEHLSPMELDILGILAVFRGLRNSRRWLFEQLEFNPVTSRRYPKRLLDSKYLRLLYLPSLEYCGLPIGLIVGGKFKNTEKRRLLVDWMVSQLPFVRVLKDDSKNVVAYLRLPADAITSVRGILREVFKSEATDWFISGIMSNQTYLMTVFHRLYGTKKSGWVDPWS